MKTEKEEPTARVTMRLPEVLWKAVQHRAVDEHITLSKLVGFALSDYLSRPLPSKIIGRGNLEAIRRGVALTKALQKGGR